MEALVIFVVVVLVVGAAVRYRSAQRRQEREETQQLIEAGYEAIGAEGLRRMLEDAQTGLDELRAQKGSHISTVDQLSWIRQIRRTEELKADLERRLAEMEGED